VKPSRFSSIGFFEPAGRIQTPALTALRQIMSSTRLHIWLSWTEKGVDDLTTASSSACHHPTLFHFHHLRGPDPKDHIQLLLVLGAVYKFCSNPWLYSYESPLSDTTHLKRQTCPQNQLTPSPRPRPRLTYSKHASTALRSCGIADAATSSDASGAEKKEVSLPRDYAKRGLTCLPRSTTRQRPSSRRRRSQTP